MRRFRKLNNGKSYEDKIKPHNFCLVGFGNSGNVKPITVYKKNSQEAVFDEFIDYNSGKIMQGVHHWKDMTQIFWDYVNHPESKFDGDIGVLQRKHLRIINVTYVGKESNDLEDSEIIGLYGGSYLKYQHCKIDIKKILEMNPKEARAIGIGKTQLYRIQKAIRSKKFNPREKTIMKLMIREF